MHTERRNAQEEGKAHTNGDRNRLAQLGEFLPSHICNTLLPLVADEMSNGAAELNAQVDGTRQLLLQSAALRRSTVLAPPLKQQLVTRAVQIQRRRAQMVQQLQRQVRHWRSTLSGGGANSVTAGGQSCRRGGPSSGPSAADPVCTGDRALGAMRATLQEVFRFEESRAHLVLAPLCPSPAALRAFLLEVVTGSQRGLHRRVVEQVTSTSPHNGQSPTTAFPSSVSVGGSVKGDRDTAQGGNSGSSGSDDAIEIALQLLLRHTRQVRTGERRGAGLSTRGRAPGSGAASPTPTSSAPLPGTTASQVSAVDPSMKVGHTPGFCDVDAYSDDVEEQMQEAEEDALASSQIPQQSPKDAKYVGETREGRSVSETMPSAAAAGEAPGKASMWLRVPGILTLSEYCAELPWVADLAGQRYTEARERKKHGSSGTGEVGYFSRHVQPDEQDSGEGVESDEVRYESGYIAPTPTALRTMPPLGYIFSPALAGGSVGSTGSSGESVVGRALRHNAIDTAGAPRASSAHLRKDREGGVSAQGEERSWLARVVVKCISNAVDAAWQDVEESVVVPFCAHRLRTHPASGFPGEAAVVAPSTACAPDGEGEGAHVEEEDTITQFMEILRVRYAVELAAQVLAARHATELLLDSEDSVIFAETRLEAFVVGGGSVAPSAAQQLSHTPAPVLTCTVLSLPGIQEIFYVVAYCTGTALLSDVALATSTSSYGVGSRKDSAGTFQRQGYLVVDVDTEEGEAGGLREAGLLGQQGGDIGDCSRHVLSAFSAQQVDLANEEDPVAQQQASLQAWAAFFEGECLTGSRRTVASGEAPWSASAASIHSSSLSLAPYYRLWLYLWEYVLVLAEPSWSSTHPLPDEDAAGWGLSRATRDDDSKRSRHLSQGQRQQRHQGCAGLARLPVASRTARRWMEKAIHAAMMRGCAEAGLLVSVCPPADVAHETVSCLQMHLSAEQAGRLVKATTQQARQRLSQVAGVSGTGTAPSRP